MGDSMLPGMAKLAKMIEYKSVQLRVMKAVFRRGSAFLSKRPKLQRIILTVIRRLGLYPLLRGLYGQLAAASPAPTSEFVPTEIGHLSPSARQIYVDLKDAVERTQKGNR